MATISVRAAQGGAKTYRARVRVKGHPLLSKTFTTKTAAKRWAAKVEQELREGKPLAQEAERHTLAEAIGRYRQHVLPGKAPGTRRAQNQHLCWWERHYGGYALARIQPPLLAEARERLAERSPRTGEPRSPATVNRYLAALGHLLSVAVREWHWLGANPMQGVSKRREASGRTRFLAETDPHGGASELERLLAACRDSASADLYPAVVLALCTGARRGEVLGLGWADLDLDHATVTFRKTKNRSVRTLELPAQAVAVLRARGRRPDTALLFPSPKDTARPVDLRSAWHTALARAGITDFRWHDLRHTAASYLAMSGLPLHEIAAVLGHKSLQMTQRYAHLAPAHVARAAATLGARVMRGVGEDVGEGGNER